MPELDVKLEDIDLAENRARALRGELYYAFTPDLTAARTRCHQACHIYNTCGPVPRRRRVELWRNITNDPTPLPPTNPDPAQDESLFDNDPWIESPIRVDYGTNVTLGTGVYINFNCTILDTCAVSIGARTLLASNVSIYSATHPLEPEVRKGTKGPESGKPVSIGEDCFIGGNVVVCPGVSVGDGSTVGAGSVVTKDVERRVVVAGNPARVVRRLGPVAEK